jgi:hypothetical protein
MIQDINKFPFGTLARRKFRSIPDTQRSDVGVAVFPREPPVLVSVVPIDADLIQCFLLQWRTRSEITQGAC